MIRFFTTLFLIKSFLNFSQKKYPKNYFNSPLRIPIVLAGTFGELRNNHFHSGLDIKTLQKKGIPIYAPADGYISRIKISQYGYGKSLYLNHPNGYTSVYAHLQKFEKKIETYVKKIQYKKESFYTGNIFPKKNILPIKKRQIIAYTGNTGGSLGPHLHYEIRNTKTENIINPMLFGLNPVDTRKPIFKKLMIYPLEDLSRINKASTPTLIPIKKIKDGEYIADKVLANGCIGIGVSAFDMLDGASNKNGLFSLEMKVNNQRVYYHDFETFSFSESKFINLFIDYKYYARFKNRIQKLYRVKKNKLDIYKSLINNGELYIEKGSNYIVEIIAKDFRKNTSKITFKIIGVKNNTIFKEHKKTNYHIIADKFIKFSKKNVTVAFSKNTFYNNVYIDFSVKKGVAKIHKPTIPLNKNFTLTFNVNSLSYMQKKQVYIANVTNKKYSRYVRTKKKKKKVYTISKTLGSYSLKFDKIKPKIKLINFKPNQWISDLKFLKVKIKDKESGIKNWRATIDDKWILMEYNHNNGILTYDFSDKILVGQKHVFKIIVNDNVGNTNTFSSVFYRKNH